MYRVIVIDDEATIRKGLIGYINWQDLNCEIIGDFENGLQAIDFLKTSSVDIILSDIKMPGADGIEVAEYVYNNHPESKIILYTGYSHFEYAKSAIKYNVSDFIIKPSTMENIVNTFKNTIDKIDALRRTEHHIMSLESMLEDAQKKEKLKLIKDIVSGVNIGASKFEETLKHYHIAIDNFCLLLYKTSGQKSVNHSQTIQFINLALNEFEQYTFLLSDTTYGSLIVLDSTNNIVSIKRLSNKCLEINNFFSQYINEQIFIGMSDSHNSLENAPSAFMEAKRCLDNSFYDNTHLVVYSSLDGPKENPAFVEINLEKITKYISKDKEDLAKKTIVSMFQTMSYNKEPIDYIKSMGIAVYTICMNMVKKQILQIDDIFLSREPYQEILQARCIDDLIRVLCDMIHDIVQYLAEGSNNYVIKNANQYMEGHFEHPIKLKDIADYIHINSSYLSRLYKDKTNKTITQYLRDLRIEKAKALIAEGNNKTYAIASLVGFEDPAYFSYVFKQQTGYSPSQYKNINAK
jgi:two-component system response regulator YesN